MQRFRRAFAALMAGCVMATSLSARAGTDAIWHCSRNPAIQVTQSGAIAEDEFKLSSFDVVGVTLQDLLNVYLGLDVKISRMNLNACFMPGNDALSDSALKVLGLKSQVMKKLALKSSIVQSNLHIVTDEAQMLSCMERNFPAFGYFSGEVITEKVAPCF